MCFLFLNLKIFIFTAFVKTVLEFKSFWKFVVVALMIYLWIYWTVIFNNKNVQYNTKYIKQYNTIQYNTVQYNTIQYNTINFKQYNIIQYNIH